MPHRALPWCLQLNLRPLCPSKDPETGRLRTAALQVAEGTQVILDETCMREGQLNGTGITNLQASCAGGMAFSG